jgi:hypothetical protein
MDQIHQDAIHIMLASFQRLESQLPPPKMTNIHRARAFRYSIKSIEQAIIQKLARFISGLQACSLLLDAGFVQELGVIQRTLDDFGEDIKFLVIARTNDRVTPLHEQFLKDFYMEEFDESTSKPTEFPKRSMVKREKIRAYCARILLPKSDPFTSQAVATKVSKAYSGFVHGASPHIMDMYGGRPPRFHISGLLGTPLILDHQQDLLNYYYRGFLACIATAKAFGDRETLDQLNMAMAQYVKSSGVQFK